jgi:poly(A) polymerase
MDNTLNILLDNNIPFLLESYSALDKFFRIKEPGFVYIITEASLITLATLFRDLSYPGLPYADACLTTPDQQYFFRCVDMLDELIPYPFTVQNLAYDLKKKKFIDKLEVYQDLRKTSLTKTEQPLMPWVEITEAAKLVSRYHYTVDIPSLMIHKNGYEPSLRSQQDLLVTILNNEYSEKGLNLLYQTGFIDTFWPELSGMYPIKQTKDYHPEGNVWEHTLEALKYRKDRDITLSLALLLHDIGKTASSGTRDKPFRNHAELGASIGSQFLKRMGFNLTLVRDVAFLIRYHMLPAALKKLPLYRIENTMNSPLFPLLLELYRADMSSTFMGPESYYHACRVYKAFMKKRDNPYKVMDKSRQVL